MEYKTKCTNCNRVQGTIIIEVCPECNSSFEVDDCHMSGDGRFLIVKCPECSSQYETVATESCSNCNEIFEVKLI